MYTLPCPALSPPAHSVKTGARRESHEASRARCRDGLVARRASAAIRPSKESLCVREAQGWVHTRCVQTDSLCLFAILVRFDAAQIATYVACRFARRDAVPLCKHVVAEGGGGRW